MHAREEPVAVPVLHAGPAGVVPGDVSLLVAIEVACHWLVGASDRRADDLEPAGGFRQPDLVGAAAWAIPEDVVTPVVIEVAGHRSVLSGSTVNGSDRNELPPAPNQTKSGARPGAYQTMSLCRSPLRSPLNG